MKGISFFFCLVVGWLALSLPSFAQDVVIPILTNNMEIDSLHYRCDAMVQSINRLRHLGKDQALKVLTADLKTNFNYDVKIMCICRLLFENPKGWKPIAGAEMYREMIDTNALEKFQMSRWH